MIYGGNDEILSRVKLLSNLLLGISVPLGIYAFFLSINLFMFVVFILISLLLLLLGLVLRLIAKEANEEIHSIYNYYDPIINEIKENSKK